MRNIHTLGLIAVLTAAHAQPGCDGIRYLTGLFDSVDVTTGVAFGSNTPVTGGGQQTLFMDIYQPAGDLLEERPVVLVAFGGSFIAGQRGDVADLCERFARMGYVAVAPDYRVGFFFPNANTTQLAVVRCLHDLRAAIRFLRKTVEMDGNPYRIDAGRIIAGGVSAGGIGAIHVAYLDQSSEIPEVLYDDTLTIGGLEGNSGWPGYSSEINACWSMSGAIGDTTWVDPGDVPCISLHEVGDGVVPYGTEEVSVIGIPTGLVASGSSDLHLRMDNAGVPNCFVSYPGNGHVGYLNYDLENAFGAVARFCADVVCGTEITCGQLPTAVAGAQIAPAISIAPNPTSDVINIRLEVPSALELIDAQGRVVRSSPGLVRSWQLDLTAEAPGIYLLRSVGGDLVERIVRSAR
jgi:para-nitrobenzyl esterase